MAGSPDLTAEVVQWVICSMMWSPTQEGHCPYRVAKATAVTRKEASGRWASGEGMGP